jgi:hypothetical protein
MRYLILFKVHVGLPCSLVFSRIPAIHFYADLLPDGDRSCLDQWQAAASKAVKVDRCYGRA